MVEDIKDPQCGYWLYSNYFEVLPPTERTLTRWWQAPLYIDYDRSGEPALWNPIFEDDALLVDVILKTNCQLNTSASELSTRKSGAFAASYKIRHLAQKSPCNANGAFFETCTAPVFHLKFCILANYSPIFNVLDAHSSLNLPSGERCRRSHD